MRASFVLFLVAVCMGGAPAARAQAPAFDPASVVESRGPLPPFPFFQAPQGLTGKVEAAKAERKFDRANVIAFLNSRSDAPLPLPAAPAEAAAPTDDKAAATKPGTGPEQPGPQKAEDEPAGAKKPGGGDAMNQPAPAH